ncbi:two-component sensor histidine kinase [Romboutsia maritimum]|uniref:histidine kinase n=1 Tax=Romboutsia maritimum TaxID=2020948 RepID=A0A371IVN7_9FIRM|nr:histidine kinase dimerization/phospho-acceptor domain-containing protein [Romboutsia maritimum]RDY24553.1 two-component sensor histidine kinase [Romboutsia maritimum]
MKKNKKLKIIFLILSIISVIVGAICSVILIDRGIYRIVTDDSYKEKHIIEKDFYKSYMFNGELLPDTIYQLSDSVLNVADGQEGQEQNDMKEIKESNRDSLNSLKNMKFLALNEKTKEIFTNTEFKNIEEFKSNIKGYLDIDINSKNTTFTKKLDNKVYNEKQYYTEELFQDKDIEIYASFPKKIEKNDKILKQYDYYQREIKYVEIGLAVIITSVVLFIVSMILYKKIKVDIIEKDGLFLKIYNKIPMELNFIAIYIVIIFMADNFYDDKFLLLSISLVLFSYLFVTINQFKAFDKKIDILKTSYTVKLGILLSKQTKNAIKATKRVPLIKRIFVIGAVCIILNIASIIFGLFGPFSVILIPFTTLSVFTYYIIKKLTYLSYIIEGTEKIKNGQLNYKIPVIDNDNFTVLAENINNIGDGLDKAIEEQVKSERMKSELITNVSHDLKTPLTSIINYVDLIKKEDNIEPEHIRDYVNVLDSKSKRLKTLIEDLFEASKASSGNLELNMENIDLNQLLIQSIGEMEEKLSNAKLDIKLNMPEDKVYINADGKRLYRVLENLLSNIAKYSLSNTRVYIDLYKEDNNVNLTMKNISSYELNFNPEEIVERFKRADESRNTEGSGLGLAISRDLVKIQGGKFDIQIDGDLFKVQLEFGSI